MYDEDAFKHFLEIERARAERSGRSLLLLLVEAPSHAEGSAVDAHTVNTVCRVLSRSVRETDFIGWYRAHRTLGAVMAQGPGEPTIDDSRSIGERISALLVEQLPHRLGAPLEVRVLQLRAQQRSHNG